MERIAPGAGIAAQRPEAAHDLLRLLAGLQRDRAVERDQLVVPDDHLPLPGEVHRHDRDLLQVDVLPDVELGPVGEREDADGFALVDLGVVEVPQLRPLVLGVPLAELVAEREDALLGPRFLLLAPRPAEGGVELVAAARRPPAPGS